jgi:hypothetical protein
MTAQNPNEMIEEYRNFILSRIQWLNERHLYWSKRINFWRAFMIVSLIFLPVGLAFLLFTGKLVWCINIGCAVLNVLVSRGGLRTCRHARTDVENWTSQENDNLAELDKIVPISVITPGRAVVIPRRISAN